jgi:uncharacterized peroxidase-related enzyme
MPRLQTVNAATASPELQQTFAVVQKSLGVVPNLIATLAQSPAALNAYLGFSGALAKGSLPARLRQQIALVVGQANECDYCVAAHSLLGAKAGLSQAEVIAAREGHAADPKSAAAVTFAKKVVAEHGHVSDEEVAGLRAVGFPDGDIAEIVANTALNIFTNYFNHVAETVVDFPAVPKLEVCSCGH